MARKKKKSISKKWIQEAVGKNPGGLHHALNIPVGKKIPSEMIAEAAKKGGRVGKMARLAKTLKGLKKKGRKKA